MITDHDYEPGDADRMSGDPKCRICGETKRRHGETDPYAGKPWGEQQEQVDWLESRYDDQYESWDD